MLRANFAEDCADKCTWVKKLILVIVFSTLLGGCVSLGKVRPTEFNIQAGNEQDKTLLLNVLRAAKRTPMHFTELSTLSATYKVTGGLELALPFSGFHGGSDVLTATPSVSASKSPTYNMAVLDTQEFYRGMLEPLSLKKLDLYLNEGLPKEMVLMLGLGGITFEMKKTGETIFIPNNFHVRTDQKLNMTPSTPYSIEESQYARFKEIIRALITRGLTIEKISAPDTIGPPLSDEAFQDPKALAKLDAQKLHVIRIGDDDCKNKSDTCPGGTSGLRLEEQHLLEKKHHIYLVQKDDISYRFCFNTLSDKNRAMPKQQANTGKADPEDLNVEKLIQSQPIPDNVKCKSDASAANDRGQSLSFPSFSIKVHPRSTEGVIYFLGEIARCELMLNPYVECKSHTPSFQAESNEVTLFNVWNGEATDSPSTLSPKVKPRYITIVLDGENYTVAIDPTGHDRTGAVLGIVTQLLALNRSAKDFPAPSVIPLISP